MEDPNRRTRTLLAAVVCLAVNICGEEVTLRLRQPDLDDQGRCVLPSELRVRLESEERKREFPEVLVLSRSGVVAEGPHHVTLMQRDTQGEMRLHHHRDATQVLGIQQAYHNHTVGAAFIVCCASTDTGRMFFRLEGSVYHKGNKYRLAPATSDTQAGRDRIQFDSHGVAVVYSIISVWEHSSYDAAGVDYHSKSKWTNRDFSPAASVTKAVDGVFQPTTRGDSHSRDLGDSLVFSKLHRNRRQTRTYYVDILPVVDYSMYSRWFDIHQSKTTVQDLLLNYLITILTAVDMRLQTLALGDTRLRVRMVTPVISTEPDASPYTESIKVQVLNETRVSAPRLLVTFDEWIKSSQATLPKHDHAMLFTSYDLIPSNNPLEILKNITKGLANIARLCKDGSVSLIEDKGAYQSENVAAHELGHGLGSLHDGENNACKSTDRYLMATGTFPQLADNLLHPWLFSSCSSVAIATYVTSLEQDTSSLNDCLLRQEGDPVTSNLTLTAQSVCERYYGNTSFPCRNFANFSEICTILRCRTLEDANCILVVPPTGTCCGPQKKCLAGTCVDADEGECPIPEECPLGDQPTIPLNNQATTCGEESPALCYGETFRRYCCATCQTHETGDADCPYGDRADCATLTVAASCTNTGIASQCCGTCARLTAMTRPTAVTIATTASAATTSPEPISSSSSSNTEPPSTASEPASTASTAPPSQPATTSPATTSPATPQRPPGSPDEGPNDVYGYKPDGFVGCYLPPCAAKQLFNLNCARLLTLAALMFARFTVYVFWI